MGAYIRFMDNVEQEINSKNNSNKRIEKNISHKEIYKKKKKSDHN